MKKNMIITVVSVLFLVGCGQKAPNLDGYDNVSDTTQIAGDTVTVDESINTESSGMNSSADGFQSIYFQFNDFGLSSDMENSMDRNIQVANSKSAKIKVEGNCDEFGTDEYNYALGLKRAKAVKDGLTSQGVDANNIVMVTFGESSPLCSSPTDECYAKNRRVDLRLAQ
ncbi:MAG: OmpA family protein [Campylobacterota bacterium]|nr:OmpA family protein [Campylobacterota bacterium]